MNLPRMLDKAGAVGTLGAALGCIAGFPSLAVCRDCEVSPNV